VLSKNKIKLINSLKITKYRNELQCYIAEGSKLVGELLSASHKIRTIVATENWVEGLGNEKLNWLQDTADELIVADLSELARISSYESVSPVVAVVEMPHYELVLSEIIGELSLVLDEVQNPGNLGATMRVADWYGIQHIICSENSVDIFNPKSVQSTMGAIFRVKVHYADLEMFFTEISKNAQFPIYGTFLEGENIYTEALSRNGLIIMGNEGKGISHKLHKFITKKLFIPPFPSDKKNAESLNVSTATAVICSEFRRRI